MAEETKQLVDRLMELWNTGNTEAAGQLYSPDAQRFDPNGPDPLRGPEQIATYISQVRAGFPDFRIDVDQRVSEGDSFAHQWKCSGTHKGEFQGIAATGKRVELVGMTLGRIRDGLVVQERSCYDRLSLMQQLGVIPTAP